MEINAGLKLGPIPFSDSLKGYRNIARISLKSIAKLIDKSSSYMCGLESNTLPIPTDKIIYQLANIIGLNKEQTQDLIVKASLERGYIDIRVSKEQLNEVLPLILEEVNKKVD